MPVAWSEVTEKDSLAMLKPKDVKEQGQFTNAQKGGLIACLWKAKTSLYFMPTAENPATLEIVVTCKSKNEEMREIRAPTIVPEYNNNMTGADQLRTTGHPENGGSTFSGLFLMLPSPMASYL